MVCSGEAPFIPENVGATSVGPGRAPVCPSLTNSAYVYIIIWSLEKTMAIPG